MKSILFVSADPSNASRLRLGEEYREIKEKLQLSKFRDDFVVNIQMSVRPSDLTQALLDINPTILHFSGHGVAVGALCFENAVGEMHPISNETLAALFEQFNGQLQCVLLNACYSATQAETIAKHVPYVIGMKETIRDDTAINFSLGFYQALGAGKSIEEAFTFGCLQIRLQNIPEHLIPILIKRRSAKTEDAQRENMSTKQKLKKALGRLSTHEISNNVIMPLFEVLHPGRLEFISNNTQHGALVLSYGMDFINRPHILCALVYSIDSSHIDLESEITKSVEILQSCGVQREDGQFCIPDDILILLFQPAFDGNIVDNIRKQLNNNPSKIKIVFDEELCDLVIKHVPQIASWLADYSSPEVINLLSAISKHNEGRAFGFANDRNIDEFYVVAALSPHATTVYSAIRSELSVADKYVESVIPLRDIVNAFDVVESDSTIQRMILERSIRWISNGALNTFNVTASMRLSESIGDIREKTIKWSYLHEGDFIGPADLVSRLKAHSEAVTAYLYESLPLLTREWIDSYSGTTSISKSQKGKLASNINDLLKNRGFYTDKAFKGVRLDEDVQKLLKREIADNEVVILNRLLLESAFPKEIARNRYLGKEVITIGLDLKLSRAFKAIVEDTKKSLMACPSVLEDSSVNLVIRAWDRIEFTERFIKFVADHFKVVTTEYSRDSEDGKGGAVRIRIPHPAVLLDLGKVVLVEGPPGCGKTTLLKMLALDLLSKDKQVLHLPCFSIPPKAKKMSLQGIAKKFSQGTIPKSEDYKDCVLIIDGLDEAPFNLSKLILASFRNFAHIVVSARNAYATVLRDNFFRVTLSPFDDEERDYFFEKWFGAGSELIKHAKELISTYPDIDAHTRLPLIATITVALLQNGIVPKTRAEIYGSRLDLLLSKWDRSRGVSRLHVDNPDAKRRFLRDLAFIIHSLSGRQRNISFNRLREVYEASLGNWGYNINFNHILEDLVVGSGVLIEERVGVYSFGHLTFQEHLAGEYIAHKFKINSIRDLIGSDWWREPLNFYASIHGDITELIDYMMGDISHLGHAEQLAEMLTYAPYTSPGAIQIMQESFSQARSDNYKELVEY